MIVVTGATAEYRDLVLAQAKVCYALKIPHVTYDLAGLGFGIPRTTDPGEFPLIDGMLMAWFKPELVTGMLQLNRAHADIVCWLDADCIPTNLFERPPGDDWDAAVTLRRDDEMGVGMESTNWLNAGVVFVRANEPGRVFAAAWRAACGGNVGEQEALCRTVGSGWKRPEWAAARGLTVATRCGAMVKVLSCPEWNCWEFPPPAGVRVMHYKRGLRSQFHV